MSNIWFCSDLHFGHKGIEKFRGLSDEICTSIIANHWLDSVKKKDIVFLLGDVAFSEEGLDFIGELPGTKYLIRGNHDEFSLEDYSRVFKNIYGILKYKEFWLSHAPIHPDELRGKINLHGHVHYATIPNRNYFNCCPENLWSLKYKSLISLAQIRQYLNENRTV